MKITIDMTKAEAKIVNGKIVIVECYDNSFCASLESEGYLKNREMSPLEALYQLAKSSMRVSGKSGWEAAIEVLEAVGLSIGAFLVYHDLRRRGRKARAGFRESTLVFEHEGKIAEVIVVEEGKEVEVGRLAEKVREIQAGGREAIIAVVDESGVISYYHGRVVRGLS